MTLTEYRNQMDMVQKIISQLDHESGIEPVTVSLSS